MQTWCRRTQTFMDLFLVLLQSIFCSVTPWWKKPLPILKLFAIPD